MTNHSLVAVLSGIAVIAHGLSKPSCEQVIVSPESCMASQNFSLHPRCVGGVCTNPDGKGGILHFVGFVHILPRKAKKSRG